jgi:UPF0755 protein
MSSLGKSFRFGILGGLLAFSLIIAFYQFALSAPSDFVSGTPIVIDSGQSISSIADELYMNNIVRSPILFRSLVIFYGGERRTSAGLYVFSGPQDVFQIAHRISNGDYGYVPVKLTLPEGLTSVETARLVHDKFPQINVNDAEIAFKPHEGKLFPETYFFPPQAPLQMILDRLLAQFDRSIGSRTKAIEASGRSLDEILILASILEEEVQNDTDRRLVAGLILRRLEIDMPLQVDSTLGYVTGKASLQLTLKDLQLDSPYNSYKYKGLPPAPISNPGLSSIDAALNPTPNKYLYFLSDKDGINHFAVTYGEHVKNRKKYLGK